MTHDAPLILAAALYVAALVLLYNSIQKESPGWRTLSLAFAVAGALFHSGVQINHWFGEGMQDVSLPHLLSLCALVIMLLLIVSAFTRRTLYDAGLVALPIAAAVVLLEWVVPPQPIPLDSTTPGITLHLISSVLSFGLLSIAGVYALFAYLADYFLRHHHINPLVRTLPALEVLEDLLFKLIAAGFLLLTVSLASGVVFINDIFAQHLVHKTVLSILAWLVFGLLLWGRWRYGWRGRLAVRLTLAGIALLVLSYFGSKYVLEVLLDSNWQT
ncbi:MAG: cytochrome c biogenesis protein CcsA [Xanthomonadales bacterium]|nr:cytochrome c biogenesis protein CcsA [Xanthomonadales bacterium]